MNRNRIVLGASTGGIESLAVVLDTLPATLPAAVFIVQHLSPDSPQLIVEILQRRCRLPVSFAEPDLPIENGRVYVARPNLHLFFRGETMVVTFGPRENGFRPAIDSTFRSAAISWGPRVVAAVLSGALDDGARGAAAVRECGGRVVVQDPVDSISPSMPLSVLKVTEPDAICALEEVGPVLARYCQDTAPAMQEVPTALAYEHRSLAMSETAEGFLHGPQLNVVCPECGGPLTVNGVGPDERFVCHAGHVFSAASLVANQGRDVERALFTALRTLQERVRLLERMSDRDASAGNLRSSRRYRERADEVVSDVEVLRNVLYNHCGEASLRPPDASADERKG